MLGYRAQILIVRVAPMDGVIQFLLWQNMGHSALAVIQFTVVTSYSPVL